MLVFIEPRLLAKLSGTICWALIVAWLACHNPEVLALLCIYFKAQLLRRLDAMDSQQL